MLKFIRTAILALALMSCVPSRSPEQVNLVTAIATGSGEAGAILAAQYQDDALAAIRNAPNESEALEELSRVDAAWEPVWAAWDELRNQLDGCLMSAERCDEQLLALAWCSLEKEATPLVDRFPRVVDCK